MPAVARKPEPEPDVAAPIEPAVPIPMVTVAYDGGVHTLPDLAVAFEEFRKTRGVLLGRWAADRLAADLLAKMLSLDSVPVWVYLDDEPVAYKVVYRRKSQGRCPRAEIVGAARYAARLRPGS